MIQFCILCHTLLLPCLPLPITQLAKLCYSISFGPPLCLILLVCCCLIMTIVSCHAQARGWSHTHHITSSHQGKACMGEPPPLCMACLGVGVIHTTSRQVWEGCYWMGKSAVALAVATVAALPQSAPAAACSDATRSFRTCCLPSGSRSGPGRAFIVSNSVAVLRSRALG